MSLLLLLRSASSRVVAATCSSAAISGSPVVGSALRATATTGGSPAPTVSYQWQHETSVGSGSYTNIAATASSYTVGNSDLGLRIRVVVTADNTSGGGGSASSTSAATAAVTAPAVSTIPVFHTEVAFATTPGSPAPVWTDISAYVKKISYTRGRQHELDVIQTGTATLTLNNSDRRFDPDNAAGPYYPNVLPIRRIRISADLAGSRYPLFTGYVERWPRQRKSTTWSEIQLTAVDGFEALGTAALVSTTATLTTQLPTANANITYTAVNAGADGNAITVSYAVAGKSTAISVTTTDTDIVVNVATDSSGKVSSKANDVIAAVNADPLASALVTAAAALGNDGTGLVSALSPIALSGGTWVKEQSGARVNAILDYANWPAGDRNIDGGQAEIQNANFQVASNENALQHLLDVEASESGLFFIAGDGNATFLERHALISSPYTVSQATFSDAPGLGELPYFDITPSEDKDLVFNDWQSQRQGSSTTVEAKDAASIDAYFRRSQTLQPLTTTDLDALAQVQFELSRHKDPSTRYDALVTKPGSSQSRWLQVLAREIGDRITVKETKPPGGGAAVVTDQHIQQITLDFDTASVTSATCTWSLLPADNEAYVIHDDPVFGVHDSNNKIAY